MAFSGQFDSDFTICNSSIIRRNCLFGLAMLGSTVCLPSSHLVVGNGTSPALISHSECEVDGKEQQADFNPCMPSLLLS